jgi:hypothetical protein
VDVHTDRWPTATRKNGNTVQYTLMCIVADLEFSDEGYGLAEEARGHPSAGVGGPTVGKFC